MTSSSESELELELEPELELLNRIVKAGLFAFVGDSSSGSLSDDEMDPMRSSTVLCISVVTSGTTASSNEDSRGVIGERVPVISSNFSWMSSCG